MANPVSWALDQIKRLNDVNLAYSAFRNFKRENIRIQAAKNY